MIPRKIDWKTGKDRDFGRHSIFTIETGRKNWNLNFKLCLPPQISRRALNNGYNHQSTIN